ncbi:MAG TPA: universal stress protein [Pseudomonas sp.]|nr:universal stress protein [Pseudomonas sp.]
MFKTALVALDLFDLAPACKPLLACVPELRDWGVDKVVLAHVIDVGYGHSVVAGHEQYYLAELQDCALPLRAAGFAVDLVVRDAGAPGDALLAIADEAAADLVVIGSRSQNVVTRLFLGGTARAVIRKTRLPLLLEWLEPGADAGSMDCAAVCHELRRKVLLATDFSRHASAAERAAIALVKRGRPTDCLHVMSEAERAARPAWPIMVRAALGDLLDRVHAGGGTGRSILEEGVPAESIARVARGGDYSLVVVGKHGQNWVETMLIGSTAARVCETAGRPVLMVPLPRED